MMNINLIKSKVIPILLIVSLFGVLFISVYMVKQRQDIRSKAVGTGEVNFFLSADRTNLNLRESTNISIMMHNTTTNIFRIRTAGVSLQFDSKVFNAGPNLTCNKNIFRENPVKRTIEAGLVSLTCMVEGGSVPYQLGPSNSTVKLAEVTLTAATTVQVSNSIVKISRAILPRVQTYTDVSNSDLSNTVMSFNIAAIPPSNSTPTPILTPPPTSTPPPSIPKGLILNSGTGKSCDQICQEKDMTWGCNGVTHLTSGTITNMAVKWVSGSPSGYCAIQNSSCSDIMSDNKAHSCSGQASRHLAVWTYCVCHPRQP